MDTIFINQLQVEAVIGVYDWEREAPQPLILSLEIGYDLAPAGDSDDLSQTLDYFAISERLRDYCATSEFQLLEALAAKLAALVIEEFGAPWLRLTINKPQAVPTAVGGVGITIERGQRG